ncbi:MAG: hypothetical protein Q7K03_10405 [Dehalococcoidia bacterium]|nr:hypothetical protein [Dehalococcoidia bacterium]
MVATATDVSLAGLQPGGMVRPSNAPVLRVAALMAGGSLLAASVVLLSIAGTFPHPGHQAMAALATFLLALMVLGSALGITGRNRASALFQFGAYTLLVMALPMVRYVPFVFKFVYLNDLESLFPPLWPYAVTIPLLFALLGELLFSSRQRTAPVLLVAASLVPAVMLLFFSSEVVQAMGATMAGVVFPWKVLLALGICIAASALIVLGTTGTTRGLTWLGLMVLLSTGLSLEVVSTFLYGSAAFKPFDLGLPRLSAWIALAAGTVPGALTLLLSVAVVAAHASRRRGTPEME